MMERYSGLIETVHDCMPQANINFSPAASPTLSRLQKVLFEIRWRQDHDITKQLIK